jgi:hypothetical protein
MFCRFAIVIVNIFCHVAVCDFPELQVVSLLACWWVLQLACWHDLAWTDVCHGRSVLDGVFIVLFMVGTVRHWECLSLIS